MTDDKPMRLENIAAECFPDGSVTVAALRREIARGRLVAWRVAGKDLTTKGEIEKMLDLCRVVPRRPVANEPDREERCRIAQEAVRKTLEAARQRSKSEKRQQRGK